MKYYTICQFTPSYQAYSRSKYARVFAHNPEGFLFHDTENDLDIRHIRKALYRLAELHQQDESTKAIADTALVIRVNAKTLAATFSMSGLPRPVKIRKGYWNDSQAIDWLSENNLSGWYLESVKDSSVPPTEVNYSQLYDHCENLMRLMGNCPCELQKTGECAEQLVWSKWPSAFQDAVIQRSHYGIEPDMLRKVRYKEVDGFHLVSGSHTTTDDFNASVRPWDNHDFSQVEERKHELSVRGKTRHVKEARKKAICTECVFSLKSYKGNVSDCGQLGRCTSGIKEEDAWTTLYHWLDKKSGFMNMPGFTEEQRQHLIRLSGITVTARVLYESRQTKTVFGGFMKDRDDDWAYFLSAGAGNLNVKKGFKDYESLQAALNTKEELLGAAPSITMPLSKKLQLACAILGEHSRVTQAYQGYHPVCTVIASVSYGGEGSVELMASSGNYKNIRWTLYETSSVANFVEKHMTFENCQMALRFASLHANTESRLHLPVIKG